MFPDVNPQNEEKLLYGENPHQEGYFYSLKSEENDPLGIQKFKFLQGRDLSYNNYLDADGALYALSHIARLNPGKVACVVVKHTNPCGAALRDTAEEAYRGAWYEGDSLAAFGGIMAINREVDTALAEVMVENLFDILMAPSITEEAQAVFGKRKKLRLLVNPALAKPVLSEASHMHKVRGGILVQSADTVPVTKETLKIVTKKIPTEAELNDLLFAWAVCRATKSNTVVAVKNETLIASGAGQQDRKRCAELCVSKGGKRVQGAVAASDAFFPFPDALQVLTNAGIAAVIQPGGSVKDADVIKAADDAGIAMVFSGIRAFRH
jgi:phosphoribosylaminoimidazolecarboxamide formyltransferase / IMP cyclohydrolase